MITHPIASMYPDIKRLWQQAFGDTNAWLDAYFRLRHADAHMYVTVVEEEEIASMLSLLPLDLVYDKQHFSARYLYAVATDEQWRGLGLSQTMTEQALMDVQAQGVQAVVTVPATPSLFSFYAKQGFVPFSAVQTLDLDGSSLPLPCDGSIEPCDAPLLFALRKQLLQDSPFIWGQWDIPALHYALSAAEQTGGGAYQLSIDGQCACAVVECAGNQAWVKELLLGGLSQTDALGLLHTLLQAEQYHLRLPARESAPYTPFSMIHWLDPQAQHACAPAQGDAYLALVLD